MPDMNDLMRANIPAEAEYVPPEQSSMSQLMRGEAIEPGRDGVSEMSRLMRANAQPTFAPRNVEPANPPAAPPLPAPNPHGSADGGVFGAPIVAPFRDMNSWIRACADSFKDK